MECLESLMSENILRNLFLSHIHKRFSATRTRKGKSTRIFEETFSDLRSFVTFQNGWHSQEEFCQINLQCWNHGYTIQCYLQKN